MDVREKSRKFALWFCAGATRFFHVLARQARGIVQVHEIFIAATENGAGIQYAVIRITNRDIRRRERGTGTYHTRKEFLRLRKNMGVTSIHHRKRDFLRHFGGFSHNVEWNWFECVPIHISSNSPRKSYGILRSKGRYIALGHFSSSNFFKLLLAKIWKNKNYGSKEW